MQAAQKTATPAPSTSRLAKVQKGKLAMPLRLVIYGTEGVGKSTLAAHAPAPIWLDIEDGSGRLDVPRYSFRDGPSGHVPLTYDEVLRAIEDLATGEHEYKTLVIDTADRLEALLWRHMIERDKSKVKGGVETIEDYGYGKGYNIAVDEWRGLCARLDALRARRGMSLILLAHATVKAFKNPEGDDFDRYNLQINEKAAGFIKGWADIVGFACFEGGAGKTLHGSRIKGWQSDRRLLKLARTAAYDAKGRGGMPAEVELDASNPWGPLAKAMDDAASLTPEQIAALVAEETARIGDDALRAKVDAAVAAALGKNDTDTLNRYLNELKRRPSVQTQA